MQLKRIYSQEQSTNTKYVNFPLIVISKSTAFWLFCIQNRFSSYKNFNKNFFLLVTLDNFSGVMCCSPYSIFGSKSRSCHRYNFFEHSLQITCFILLCFLPCNLFICLCFIFLGKHLAEHCKLDYPKLPRFILWILAEVAIVASDIPEGQLSWFTRSIHLPTQSHLQAGMHSYSLCIQALTLTQNFVSCFNIDKFFVLFTVIGTAFALNMLFKIPVWCGVLLTGLSTLLLLALQQYGVDT